MPARPAAVAGGAGIRCPPLQLPRAARAGYRHDHTAPEPTEVQPRSSLFAESRQPAVQQRSSGNGGEHSFGDLESRCRKDARGALPWGCRPA